MQSAETAAHEAEAIRWQGKGLDTADEGAGSNHLLAQEQAHEFQVFLPTGDLSRSESEIGKKSIFRCNGKNFRVRERAAWIAVCLSALTVAHWET